MEKLNWINLYTTDAAFNLAAEEYIFEKLPKDRAWFMLWQNDRAVIIGRYQNTRAEINEEYLRANGIKPVRRLSGGGAVYHDLGNLNFTFITDAGDSETLDMRLFCEPIAAALEQMGVNAEINGRNDITIDGKKFSGNAQYIKDGRTMHHGTIMFSSDLSVLGNALKADPAKLESKGIKSVRSRVTNVSEHVRGDMSLEEFRALLIKYVAEEQGGEEYRLSKEDIAAIEKLRDEKYALDEWNYGKSPKGILRREEYIPGCGKLGAYMTVEHDRIETLEFRGDFFSKKDPSELAEKLQGAVPDREGIMKILESVDTEEYFLGAGKENLLKLLV